jgi:DNA repair protein RadA/Sms
MKKPVTQYVCQNCGATSIRWVGRCPSCGEWNSLEEETVVPAAAGGPSRGAPVTVAPLREAQTRAYARISTGIGELDRVLGGGAIPGMTVLIGGDPGIGKSTLLLQAFARLDGAGVKALYGTCEESVGQLAVRAERMGLKDSGLLTAAVTELGELVATIEATGPGAVVVDSIQMLRSSELPGVSGSVSQLRTCSAELVQLAKQKPFVLFLVGHITKGGAIAGPKLLEHMVDTVLYFEGDQAHSLRLLRAAKNRYGPTDEVGVFEMRGEGLVEVANPSERLLSERVTDTAGSVVTSLLEGTRTMFVEVQALVSRSVYGAPERRATGVDYRRVCMILGVVEKRAGIRLGMHDVFVNVAGGVRALEPGVDLAIALAVASSQLDRPFPADTVAIGELGLGGEVRRVGQMGMRLREAAKLGFRRALVPPLGDGLSAPKGLGLERVRTLSEALKALQGSGGS